MNRGYIIRMAREAGWDMEWGGTTVEQVMAFAEVVAASERRHEIFDKEKFAELVAHAIACFTCIIHNITNEETADMNLTQEQIVKLIADAFRVGRAEGMEIGHKDGYENGLRDGDAEGYERGYGRGARLALLNGGTQAEWDMVQSIARAIRARGEA